MANYSFYEVHIRASRKAALMIFRLLPEAFDDKTIRAEITQGEEYILHAEGVCQWELNAYRDTHYDGPPADLTAFCENEIRAGTVDCDALPYSRCNLRVLSALFGCEIQAQEFSPEWLVKQFQHVKNGEELAYERVEESCLLWNKAQHPTFEDFCLANKIDQNAFSESDFTPCDNGTYECVYFNSTMTFNF